MDINEFTPGLDLAIDTLGGEMDKLNKEWESHGGVDSRLKFATQCVRNIQAELERLKKQPSSIPVSTLAQDEALAVFLLDAAIQTLYAEIQQGPYPYTNGLTRGRDIMAGIRDLLKGLRVKPPAK